MHFKGFLIIWVHCMMVKMPQGGLNTYFDENERGSPQVALFLTFQLDTFKAVREDSEHLRDANP